MCTRRTLFALCTLVSCGPAVELPTALDSNEGAGPSAPDGDDGCSNQTVDCDADGVCETGLGTALHCGGCGDVCASLNGNAQCISGSCKLVCVGGYGDCNAFGYDGCESQLNADAANCGQCGTPCQEGQECVQGYCLDILASAVEVGAGLSLFGGHLYFAVAYPEGSQGEIARVATSGGFPETVVGGQSWISSFKAHDDTICWSNLQIPDDSPASTSIRMWSPALGSATTLLDSLSSEATVLEFDKQFVYVADSGWVLQVPLSGGGGAPIAGPFDAPIFAEEIDGHLYLLDVGPQEFVTASGLSIVSHPHGSLHRIDLGTLANEPLLLDLDTPSSISRCGEALYISESGSLSSYSLDADMLVNAGTYGSIARVSNEMNAREILATNLIRPGRLACDAEHIYWASPGTVAGKNPNGPYESNGGIARIGLEGGAVESISTGLDAVDIVLDDDAVAFTSRVFGLVAKVKKP